LAVFSSLKTLYQKQVGFLSLKTDATSVRKRNFLRCYYKARLDGLIARNIKSGWKASGLWPTNNAKPLLSRLLLENSNNSEDQATKRKAKEPLPD
jgi:4-hydroxybenzoate polyprenyltransferase